MNTRPTAQESIDSLIDYGSSQSITKTKSGTQGTKVWVNTSGIHNQKQYHWLHIRRHSNIMGMY